jgi:broad specificity phosphatase PhoE
MSMRRIVLVRHGESDGRSSQRLIGSGDPALSEEGRDQMLAARSHLVGHVFDLVVASPARRSWQSAEILAPGVPLVLEADFREIHFGRWEGRRLEEIEAADPVLYKKWQEAAPDFEFPGGEPRAAFRERVVRGLDRMVGSGAMAALVVAHKGVVRTIVERTTGAPLPERERPRLGEAIALTVRRNGAWEIGVRSSNPPGVPTPGPVELS